MVANETKVSLPFKEFQVYYDFDVLVTAVYHFQLA